MSHTDVHRPGWVQERDPHMSRHFAPHHYHWEHDCWGPVAREWLVVSVAPCDLPEFFATKGCPATRCRPRYAGGRNIYCGCRKCTGHHDQRAERRRDRHSWRRGVDRE